MELIFATQNPNKVKEIQNQLTENIKVLSLADLDYPEDLEETQNTLEGNAWQKADFIYEHFNRNCFADDTGLEVEALNNEPGVYSARYAGAEKSFEANMNKVLDKLKGKDNRNARFRTVIALIIDGEKKTGVELFDLKKDPSEENNLAEVHPDIVQTLSKQLYDWQRSVLNSLMEQDYRDTGTQ